MNISQEQIGSKLIISPTDRIDTKTAPEFQTVIDAIPEDITELIVDLEEVCYISSAGLRVLLIAQKRMNKQGEMKVIHANSDLMEIFEVTGFVDILTIE